MQIAIASRTKSVQPDKNPQGRELRIIPILGSSHDQPPYRLLDAATLGLVRITEVSDAGHVPELLVHNGLDVRAFLMDGQELVGAKQNRILNTDVLVPAQATLKIPVSCVEQGRWHHTSAEFSPGKCASHRTRSAKPRRVHAALAAGGTYDADQATVWEEIGASLVACDASSPTGALSAAYEKRQEELKSFRSQLVLPSDAVGLAVFHGGRFQGMDLFDRHSTLRYFWESLVDSYALDWLGSPVDPARAPRSPEAQIISQFLAQAADGSWRSFNPPGEGTDWRLEHAELTGSALVWEDRTVIHLQLFPAASQPQSHGPARRPRIRRPYL